MQIGLLKLRNQKLTEGPDGRYVETKISHRLHRAFGLRVGHSGQRHDVDQIGTVIVRLVDRIVADGSQLEPLDDGLDQQIFRDLLSLIVTDIAFDQEPTRCRDP